MALETFKILNKSSPEFIQNIITIKENPYDFRYQNTVDVPRPRTTRYDKKSFSYEAATQWNSLSNHARSLSTFGQLFFFLSLTGISQKTVLVAHVNCDLLLLPQN